MVSNTRGSTDPYPLQSLMCQRRGKRKLRVGTRVVSAEDLVGYQILSPSLCVRDSSKSPREFSTVTIITGPFVTTHKISLGE